MENDNSIVFWDENGNALMAVVSFVDEIDSELLSAKLHNKIEKFLNKRGLEVDNSSEEYLKTEIIY